MTLTDDRLTEAITMGAATATAPPTWTEVVDFGRRQRRARFGTAMIVALVAAGSVLAATFSWIGDSSPLETAAPEREIVGGTERPTGSTDSTATPVTAESAQGSWRLMDINFGPGFESATQRLVVVIDEDFIRVDGSCLGLIVATEWQDAAFVGRNPDAPRTLVDGLTPRLIHCPDQALLVSISNFLTHGDPIEVLIVEDTLLLRRDELEIRAVRVAG